MYRSIICSTTGPVSSVFVPRRDSCVLSTPWKRSMALVTAVSSEARIVSSSGSSSRAVGCIIVLPESELRNERTDPFIEGAERWELIEDRLEERCCTGWSFEVTNSRIIFSRPPCICREIIGYCMRRSPKFLITFFFGKSAPPPVLGAGPATSETSANNFLRSLLGSSLMIAGIIGVDWKDPMRGREM